MNKLLLLVTQLVTNAVVLVLGGSSVDVRLNPPDGCLFFPLAWACSENIDFNHQQEVAASPLTSLFYR